MSMFFRNFFVLSSIFLILFSSCDNGNPPSVISIEPETGSRKALVTVLGADFDDLQYINFNDDIPADFNPSFGTDKALLFRVPANAVLGDNLIRIGTEHGETTVNFNVTLEAPAVTFFSPKNANEGETIYILGENFFEPPLIVLFHDSIPGNIIYHQEDSIVVEVPPGVERGRLKVKANGGDALSGEFFFSTTEILVNDFDGNGLRSETDKWLFYGNIDQNGQSAVQDEDPTTLSGNYLKISGTDPGSIWIGGTESHANDPMVFQNFGIENDINNVFLEMDLNNNGREDTHLIIVLTERDGSINDFTEQIAVDWDGWQNVSILLNRFQDVDGATIDPAKIKNVKLHLYNEVGSNLPLEVNVDNLKFTQIN